jgi:hypothetical protein
MAVVALVAAWGAGSAGATEVAGASLTGCAGELTSLDGDGEVIDRAVGEPPHRVTDPDDGEPTFTRTHPFEVASDGVVEWAGETTTVITDQTGELTVWGVTIADNRTANDEQAGGGEGTVEIEGYLPLDLTGVVKVDGELTGRGGQCLASGWVEVDGRPFPSLAGLAALVLTGAGVALLIVAQPRQRPARPGS